MRFFILPVVASRLQLNWPQILRHRCEPCKSLSGRKDAPRVRKQKAFIRLAFACLCQARGQTLCSRFFGGAQELYMILWQVLLDSSRIRHATNAKCAWQMKRCTKPAANTPTFRSRNWLSVLQSQERDRFSAWQLRNSKGVRASALLLGADGRSNPNASVRGLTNRWKNRASRKGSGTPVVSLAVHHLQQATDRHRRLLQAQSAGPCRTICR